MDKNSRTDFYNYLTKNCKLPENKENIMLKLNKIIINSFSPQIDQNQKPKSNLSSSQPHGTLGAIEQSLSNINTTEKNLLQLDKEVDLSVSKLSSIIDSRNNLQNTLKEFNTKTKQIITEKEKMKKLLKSITSIYNFYIDSISIQEFLKNDSCVLKYRFLEDYKKISKGIGFFILNPNYTEANTYLQKYNTLKIMSVNKYYEYIEQSINNNNIINLIPPSEETFLYSLISELGDVPLEIREKYFLYLNYEKMTNLISFFEKESNDDSDIKSSHDKLKMKYIDIRLSLIKDIYNPIFKEITDCFYNQENHKLFNEKFPNLLHLVILHSFIEIVHYGYLFGHNYHNDVYILQNLTKYIYGSLYDTIRPLIVSIVSLEDLIVLFDAFTKNTAVFFLNITIITHKNELNKEVIETENKQIIDFFKGFLPKTNENLINENLNIFRNFLDINQHLMRPTLIHLIQDLQEKIYIKVSMHVKNNFNEIEDDFPSFGLYEEELNKNNKYEYFQLFHYFLKRIVILYEIFNKKLEDKIVSQIITSAIETFILALNNEILSKKNLTYEFQVYIIQQILLCIQTVNKFAIDIVKIDIDMGFGFITDVFRSNYNTVLSGKMSVSNLISSYAPNIKEKTRDFRKILYNNLLKSYKMFINLSNEFIFGSKILDINHKINDENKVSDILDMIFNCKDEFYEKIPNVKENKKKVIKTFEEQIKNIDNNVYEKIIRVFEENNERIIQEIVDFLCKNKEESKAEDKNVINEIIELFNKI